MDFWTYYANKKCIGYAIGLYANNVAYATTYFIQNCAYLDDQEIFFGRTVFFLHWLEYAWVCFCYY